ncbi:MAG: hypothetical protein KBT29_08275 [Prevotellaceae bacterium]|nr:hypothetical protein [Candidatus Minthosoma caballi]
MRKTLLFFCLCLCAGIASAAEPQSTTDKIVIGDLTVMPGGNEAYFTVSLQGSLIYTAYNMDIHLPEGLEVTYKSGKPNVKMTASAGSASSFYPSEWDDDDEIYTYSHKMVNSYGVVGDRWLRISCSSDENAEFVATSGELFKVYVKASPYMKPGEAHITVDGIGLFVKQDAEKYIPKENTDKVITVGTTSKVTVNVSAANQWGTCVLPFSASLPAGLTAYECADADGDDLVLTKASSLEAYTPYILYAPTGYSSTLSGEVDAAQYVAVATKGLLSGAIVSQTISAGYVLQNQGDGAMFYDVNGDTFSVPEGKCWLCETALLGKERYGFEQEASIIECVSKSASHDAIYNIHGIAVEKMNSGNIYIINNKKVLVK